ncbi:hypothetical protein [Francisella sp. TX07-6608]|uniref:hypothetical protein n=1 Tax=Francisella sp. TX07-6608 TaxID=573568 RepID=UPI0008F9B40B|nr:hypothetical protein [Francisella sp. TX07-6608]OIN83698.1 hypothetical protein KX00_1904 [Francisella sp. TX07-6608]
MWSVILTGLFTLLGVYVANRANLKRYELEQRDRDLKLKLEKLEEFYILFSKWSDLCYQSYMGLIYTNNSINDSLRLKSAFGNNDKQQVNDVVKLKMLLNIYFNDLNIYYEKVIEKRDILSKFINNLPQNKEDNTRLIKEAFLFSDICDQFKKKISEYSKLLLQTEAK